MPRVLVSSLGSTAAQGLVCALSRHPEFVVVGADMREDHSGRRLVREHVVLPSGSEPGFPPAVRAAVDRFALDLYVPIMEPELLAAAVHGSEMVDDAAVVLVSERLAIETCRSKRALARAFSRAGLDSPEVLTESAGFPVFVRPDRGTGSRGAGLARDVSDLERRREACAGDVVLTEPVDGPEFSLDGFADANHLVRGLVCRTREEVRGGLSVRSEVVPLPSGIASGVERLAAELGLIGFFNLQFRTAAGRHFFFDLNPRPGGAMSLSYAAGLDPAVRLLAFLGLASWPGALTPRFGLRLRRRWHDEIIEPDSSSSGGGR